MHAGGEPPVAERGVLRVAGDEQHLQARAGHQGRLRHLAAVQAARQLVSTGSADAVAISGPVDLIVSASGTLRVPHGHELLTQVVGGGCALGSVIAAFAAVSPIAAVEVRLPPALRRLELYPSARLLAGFDAAVSAAGPVALEDLRDLPADRDDRVETRERVLEDVGDAVTAFLPQLLVGRTDKIFALEAHRAARDHPGRRGDQTHDRQRRDRLAGLGRVDTGAGVAVRGIAGIKYNFTDRWAPFGEYQMTYSENDITIDGDPGQPDGKLRTDLLTHAVNVGISYSF